MCKSLASLVKFFLSILLSFFFTFMFRPLGILFWFMVRCEPFLSFFVFFLQIVECLSQHHILSSTSIFHVFVVLHSSDTKFPFSLHLFLSYLPCTDDTDSCASHNGCGQSPVLGVATHSALQSRGQVARPLTSCPSVSDPFTFRVCCVKNK